VAVVLVDLELAAEAAVELLFKLQTSLLLLEPLFHMALVMVVHRLAQMVDMDIKVEILRLEH
jgi:hypothetical protein